MSQAKAQAELARLQAQSQGQTKYQGQSCNRGHQGLRYVSNCSCVECGTETRELTPAKAAYNRAYWQRPEVKARRKAQRQAKAQPVKTGFSHAQ